MVWINALPSVGQTAWGTPLDNVIQEIRDRIEALEANGTPVTGVTSLTVAGQSVTGDVNLDSTYSQIGHPHAGTDITSGTVNVARLPTGVPLVVVKAIGGYGASAGSWPANRAAVTTDSTRPVFWVGNTDPTSTDQQNDTDPYLIVP